MHESPSNKTFFLTVFAINDKKKLAEDVRTKYCFYLNFKFCYITLKNVYALKHNLQRILFGPNCCNLDKF